VEPGVLAEREGLAHQVGAALAQGGVKALDMGRFAGLFAGGAMTLGGRSCLVGDPITRGLLYGEAVHGGLLDAHRLDVAHVAGWIPPDSIYAQIAHQPSVGVRHRAFFVFGSRRGSTARVFPLTSQRDVFLGEGHTQPYGAARLGIVPRGT
jgi:hypothetical protein